MLAEDIENASGKSVFDSSSEAGTGKQHIPLAFQDYQLRCLHVRFQLDACLNQSRVDGSRHDHAYAGLL